MTIKLIIGLQNPGSAYEHTRHNAGGWLVSMLVKRCNGSLKTETSLNAQVSQIHIENELCRVAVPTTYMNHSGQAVRALAQYYKLAAESILIVHDDLDLPPGRIKIKTGGGHGGHNGLKDIIQQLGSTNFHRLRIGIGHPGHRDLVLNYVLGKPSISDRQLIFDAIERGMAAISVAIVADVAAAMNVLNA